MTKSADSLRIVACRTCGAKIRFDTKGGRLVAINYPDHSVHRHQGDSA